MAGNDHVTLGHGQFGDGFIQVYKSDETLGVTVEGSDIIKHDATASTIASFDASKKIISLGTSTYPSLTELSYGKGVTSAIQAQIDSK